MGLRVVQQKTLQAGGAPEVAGPKPATARTTSDGYLDRIVKYIPSQVITFYTAAVALLQNTTTGGQSATTPVAAGAGTAGAPAGSGTVLWLVFVAGLGLAIFLTYLQTRVKGMPPAYKHIAISTVAFIAWAYANGGPFIGTGFWQPTWGAILLMLVVIVIGAIPGDEVPAGAGGGDAGGGGGGGGNP